MDKKEHWEKIYETKNPDEVSWFQVYPKTSMKFVELFNPGDKVRDGLDVFRHAWPDREGERCFCTDGHRRQVFERVVTELAKTVRVDRDREVCGEQHHASIRRAALDIFDTQPAACAWFVFHDDAARICALQPVGQATRCHVSAAAGRKADDHTGDFCGLGKGGPRKDKAWQRQASNRAGKNIASRNHR